MNDKLTKIITECDLCVIGGGLSGSFAALSAARHGARVVLIQDRPMLGGNASSEIRMWVRGAKKKNDRETGLISELEERNIYYNPTLVSSVFDATLYGMLAENENITMLLNTSCVDAHTENGKIVSVEAWQLTTYTWHIVKAKIFMDCSGDSILAPLVGAEYRKGRESTEEFGETLAQPKADTRTMGMSILLAARQTDKPVKFTPPTFAYEYTDDSAFMSGAVEQFEQVRSHAIGTSGCNLWWIELGGEGDTIHDAAKLHGELLASVYGVWDHIKNHGDHGMENWDLEWVGFLPGKRESRRYIGDVIVTEHDIVSGGHFDDEIAYGGWGLDDHNPFGMRKNDGECLASRVIPVKNIYGLPYRMLYSKNIDNLMFAGRNISATHAALSSTRVMATCSLLGQAAGTAAAIAVKYGCMPRGVYEAHIKELQKILLDDGVFLPHIKRETSELALSAKLNISDADKEVLFNGIDRPRATYDDNMIFQSIGDSLTFEFNGKKHVDTLRLIFDRDYTRETVSDNKKMRVYAMKLHTGDDFVPVRVASTTVKGFVIYADGKEIYRDENNFLAIRHIPLNTDAEKLEIKWISTNGDEKIRLFSADFI